MCFCNPNSRTPFCSSFKCQQELKRLEKLETAKKETTISYLKNLTEDQIALLEEIKDNLLNNYMANNIENETMTYNKDIIDDIISNITGILINRQ